MKFCPACKQDKPPEAFHRSVKTKDGLYGYCKACCKVRQADLYKRRDNTRRRTHKICTWCQQDRTREEYRVTAGKQHTRCADCEDEIAEQTTLGLRRCNICREWLPQASFYASHLAKEHAGCIPCTRAWHRGNRPNRRVFELMKSYGITAEQYDSLVAKQSGNCPVCLEPLPPDRGGYVDHVHEGKFKGRIRAILHRDCNRFVMWEHEDSGALRRAADLIDNPLTDWMVPGRPPSEVRKQARKQGKLK